LAIDRFSIELEIELAKLLRNIAEAREKIRTIETTSAEVGRNASESLNNIKLDTGEIEKSTTALEKLGGVLGGLLKFIAVGGAIVLGFSALTFVLKDIAVGGAKVTRIFQTISGGLSTAAGSAAGLSRVLLGNNNILTVLLGKIASLTGSFAGLSVGIATVTAQLNKNPGFRDALLNAALLDAQIAELAGQKLRTLGAKFTAAFGIGKKAIETTTLEARLLKAQLNEIALQKFGAGITASSAAANAALKTVNAQITSLQAQLVAVRAIPFGETISAGATKAAVAMEAALIEARLLKTQLTELAVTKFGPTISAGATQAQVAITAVNRQIETLQTQLTAFLATPFGENIAAGATVANTAIKSTVTQVKLLQTQLTEVAVTKFGPSIASGATVAKGALQSVSAEVQLLSAQFKELSTTKAGPVIAAGMTKASEAVAFARLELQLLNAQLAEIPAIAKAAGGTASSAFATTQLAIKAARLEAALLSAQLKEIAVSRIAAGFTGLGKTAEAAFVRTRRGLESLGVGISAGISGVGKFSKEVGTKAIGAADGLANAVGRTANSFNIFGVAVDKAAIAVFALELAFTIIGRIVQSIGFGIIKSTLGMAEAAGDAELAFRQLGFALDQANSSIRGTIGTSEEFTGFIQELSATSGVAIDDLARLTAQFLTLNDQFLLTGDELKQVIQRTVAVGVVQKDLQRAVTDVKDAFLGVFGPLKRFTGIELSAAEVSELAAEQHRLQADALEGVANSSERAAKSQVVFQAIMQGTEVQAKTLNETTDSLTIATTRLNGALRNLSVTSGAGAQKILAELTNLGTRLVKTFGLIPKEVRSVVVEFVTMQGIILSTIGITLRLVGAVILAANAFKILGLLATANIGKLGTLAAFFSKQITLFTGIPTVINSAGSALGAAFNLFIFSLRKIESAIGRVILSVLNLKISMISLKPIVIALTNAFKSLLSVQTLYAIKNFFTISILGRLVIAFALLIPALIRVNKEFGVVEKVVDPAVDALKRMFEGVDILDVALRKFGETIEVGITGAVVALESGALAATVVIFVLTKGLALLGRAVGLVGNLIVKFANRLKTIPIVGKAVAKFVAKTGQVIAKLGNSTEAALDPIADLSAGVGATLLTALEKSGIVFTSAISKMFGFGDAAGDAADDADDLSDSAKTLEAAIKAVAPSFDILLKGAQNALKGTNEAFDEQIEAVERLANIQEIFANEFVFSERDRLDSVKRINRRASAAILGIENRRFNASLRLITLREAAEISAIDNIVTKDIKGEDDKLKKFAEVRLQSIEERKKATEAFAGFLKTQLNDRTAELDAEVKAVRQAEQDIINIRRSTAIEIRQIEIGLLAADKQAAANRAEFQSRLEKGRAQAARGNVAAAEKEFSAAEGFARSGTQNIEGINDAIATAAALGPKTAQFEGLRAINKIVQGVGTLSPAAQKAKQALSAAFTFGKDPTRQITEFVIALERIKEVRVGEALAADLKQIGVAREAAAQASVNAGRTAVESLKQEIVTIEEKLAGVFAQLKTLRDSLATPIDIVAQFIPETGVIDALIARLTGGINVPVKFISGGLDTGSPVVPLRKAAEVIRNLLDPGEITAGFSAMTQGIASRAGLPAPPAGGGGPQRTVRVDINMDGESTPVTVASDADAERLTTFANRLKNIGRTKGNFRSPFVRNS